LLLRLLLYHFYDIITTTHIHPSLLSAHPFSPLTHPLTPTQHFLPLTYLPSTPTSCPGIIGSSFVMCQYWTNSMFGKNIGTPATLSCCLCVWPAVSTHCSLSCLGSCTACDLPPLLNPPPLTYFSPSHPSTYPPTHPLPLSPWLCGNSGQCERHRGRLGQPGGGITQMFMGGAIFPLFQVH
jgi:hypothetical protein